MNFSYCCVFCLSVLNYTQCIVWSVCRYKSVNIAVYCVSFGTDLYMLLSAVRLSILKINIAVNVLFVDIELTLCFVCYVCS